MPVRLPAAERRDQLLAVALGVFSRQGFHAASMNEIAEAAGVTKPVLYQHFASKRQLYRELLDEVATTMLTMITDAAKRATSPREEVELGFRAYFGFVADNTASFLLLFGSGARRDEEFAAAVRQLEMRIADTIAPLIAADIEPQHRRIVAHAILGIAEATSRLWVEEGMKGNIDLLASEVADLTWAGLRGIHRP